MAIYSSTWELLMLNLWSHKIISKLILFFLCTKNCVLERLLLHHGNFFASYGTPLRWPCLQPTEYRCSLSPTCCSVRVPACQCRRADSTTANDHFRPRVSGALDSSLGVFAYLFTQPSQVKRKRKHGFLRRLRSPGGQKMLMRRKLKGRKYLSH